MEDTRDYNEDYHPSFLTALSCRKLDEIIDQNKKVIELLEKFLSSNIIAIECMLWILFLY